MSDFNPIIHGYPYTDYHSMNLDFLMDLACASFGLHLVVDGQYLKLVNKCGQEISKVTIAYAETALKDIAGHNLTAYILSAGTDSHNLLLTKGDGNVTTITIPYSVHAEKDVNERDLISYVHSIGTANDKIVVTFGDNTTFEFTVPYAVKARDDKNGKDISTYCASIETVGDKLVVKDGNGSLLAEITVPYAEKANKDIDGDTIKETYATSITTGLSTVILRNKNGVTLSEITVPYAVKAMKDEDGNDLKSTYGTSLAVNGSKIALESRDGSSLNEITVPFATLSTDATNAVEMIQISGDNIVFTTHGGQATTITIPYAVKAQKDALNNIISHIYVANVTDDPLTGKISFYASDGTLIAEMIPTVDKAVHDSFNNTIADYIKTIVTDPNSNYVTVTHGDGDVDSITIEYSTTAWKDTYGNIIGNVYIKRLAFVAVNDDYYLVAYNGEDSEVFRIAVPDFGNDTNVYLLTYTFDSTPTAFDMCRGLAGGFNPDLVSIKNITTGEILNDLDLSVATKTGIVVYNITNFPATGIIPYSPTNDYKLICNYGDRYSFFWIESTDPSDIEMYWSWSPQAEPIGFADDFISIDDTGAIIDTESTSQNQYIFNYFVTGKMPRVCYGLTREWYLPTGMWIEDSNHLPIEKSLHTFLLDERNNTTDTFYMCYRYNYADSHISLIKIPFKNSNMFYPDVDTTHSHWTIIFF